MEPTTVDLMSRYGTVAVLVTAITSTSGGGGKGASVYVQVGYVSNLFLVCFHFAFLSPLNVFTQNAGIIHHGHFTIKVGPSSTVSLAHLVSHLAHLDQVSCGFKPI